MVDLPGPQISAAETVTVLNDLRLMAPGSLIDARLTWTAVDRHTAVVTFANGRHSVAGRILVNDAGQLTDFWSDDPPDRGGGASPPCDGPPLSGSIGTLATGT